MLVTCAQMLEAERRAFASGVDQAALMERAGGALAAYVGQCHPRPGRLILYVGKGNNGGDALVAGGHLARQGWTVHWRLAGREEDLKPLPQRHLAMLKKLAPGGGLESPPGWDAVTDRGRSTVVIDGLLGIGVEGAPRGVVAELIRELLGLRSRATVVAVDVPSGFDADRGQAADPAVLADATVTFGFLKRGFVADGAERWLGRLVLVPLPEVAPPGDGDGRVRLVTADQVAAWLPRRDGGWHKGRAGRVAVVAGSVGSTGAAALAATGALRAGAGLVTVWTRPEAWAGVAAAAPLEVMVRPLERPDQWREGRPDALVIGPGLGLDGWASEVVGSGWREAEVPVVVDADGLTLLAGDASVWQGGAGGSDGATAGLRVLTPHPGELRRLLAAAGGGLDGELSRLDLADRLVSRMPSWVWLLKAGHSLVGGGGEGHWLAATGNAGMASGGMGDVLAGVTGGLLAQGVGPARAAAAAAWLNGCAAEQALASGRDGAESLTAGVVTQFLGTACDGARAGWW